jgi:hypothetical protein
MVLFGRDSEVLTAVKSQKGFNMEFEAQCGPPVFKKLGMTYMRVTLAACDRVHEVTMAQRA